MKVTINLPEDVINALTVSAENIEHTVLKATAINFYRNGKISHAQVSEMLDFNRSETDAFLKAHNIPLNYSIEDLKQDRLTLDKLFVGNER